MEKQLVASLYRLPDDDTGEHYRLEVYEGYTLLAAFRIMIGAIYEGLARLAALERQVREEKEQKDARESSAAQGERKEEISCE